MLQVHEYARDPRLADEVCAATGCEDPAAGALLVEQAALAHPDAPRYDPAVSSSPPTKAANQTRQLLAEIAPEDGLQAIVATQLLTAHNIGMKLASAAMAGDVIDPHHPALRAAERQARTVARMAEVLGSLRRGGKQEVVVRREVVTTERDEAGREVVDRRSVEARGGGRRGEEAGDGR